MAHRSLYSGSRVSAAVKRRKAKTDLSAADLSHGGLLRCESVFRRIGSSTRTTRPMGRRDGWLWSTLGGSIWRICGAEPLRGSRQCCIGIRASIRLLPLPWLLAAHRTCHLEKFCGLQPDRAGAASSDPNLCGAFGAGVLYSSWLPKGTTLGKGSPTMLCRRRASGVLTTSSASSRWTSYRSLELRRT